MALDPARFSLAEQKNQHWCLTAEEGTKIEKVLEPSFYANVAVQVRQYDKVFVRVDSGEWYAELLVTSCGRNWAKVHPLGYIEFAKLQDSESKGGGKPADEYFAKFRGPHLKWCALRTADNECLKDGMESKQEAENWISSYLMTM